MIALAADPFWLKVETKFLSIFDFLTDFRDGSSWADVAAGLGTMIVVCGFIFWTSRLK